MVAPLFRRVKVESVRGACIIGRGIEDHEIQEGRSIMIVKLLKLLSGAAATIVGRKPTRKPCTSGAAAWVSAAEHLAGAVRRVQAANVALVQERQELRNQLRRAESRSDAEQRGEYAAELDRAKCFLNRNGFSVSRMQVASAVEALGRSHCDK